MPKRYKNSTKRKWRQQKLSVGTVAKIARKEAKKLDNRIIKYNYSNVFHATDGYNWDSVNAICPYAAYRNIQSGALESQVISDISNLVIDGSTARKSITLALKAIQCRISIVNPTLNAIRYEAMIVFIPNLNNQTDDAVDFIRPDVFMLYKKGGGGLLYDGLAKKGIRNKSGSSASVRTYTIIARKVGTIQPAYNSGIYRSVNTSPDIIAIPYPAIRRANFTLTKYFKKERRHNCKSTSVINQQFTDGNYYLLVQSDVALGSFTNNSTTDPAYIKYCAASSIKFRVVGSTQPVTT